MSTTHVQKADPALNTRNKIGLVLAGLIAVSNIPSVLVPTPEGEVGPPMVILVAGTICGVVGLVAVVMAWRTRSRAAMRIAAACLVIALLTALPALFVDVPAAIKAMVAAVTIVTLATLVLMFSGDRHRQPVLD